MLPVARLEDLNAVAKTDDATLDKLIGLALDGLEKGLDQSQFPQEAQKLVLVVAFLFSEAAKLKSSEKDFRDSLVSFPLRDGQRDKLCKTYLANAQRIRQRQMEQTSRPSHYVDCDWRLDVELASRALRRQADPTWILRLTTQDADGKQEDHVLQTDVQNLTHLYEELSMAVAEEKAGYARRISRNIK